MMIAVFFLLTEVYIKLLWLKIVKSFLNLCIPAVFPIFFANENREFPIFVE